MSYEETRELYVAMTKKDGPKRTFRVLNNGPRLRESVSIHPKIWKRLSEDLQNKIRKIRDEIREENNKDQFKSSPAKAIPPQYGLNKAAYNIVKECDDVERLAAVIQSYHLDNDTFSKDSDSDEDVRMSAMVHRVGENIEVQANVEYERRFTWSANNHNRSYAICDSGADSCVVGSMAKIVVARRDSKSCWV